MLGIATATAAPSVAATTVYGSAQLKYTVNATAQVSIATNYDPAVAGGPQKATAASILPSVAGNCSAGVAEATATLTFGGITPPGAGYTGCLYQNALSIGLLSNDASGVLVYEYLDVLAAGTQVCVIPNNTALAPKPSASTASGNPAAYTASCQVAGSLPALTAIGAASQGTAGTFGAAGNPATGGTDVTATPQYTALVGTPGPLTYTGAVNGAAFQFLGQDIQLNVSGAAASGNKTSILTIAVVPQ